MRDFRKFRVIQNEFIKKNNKPYKRYFFNKVDFNNNLIGIIGARGVGKSTFLIQYLLQAPYELSQKLYISADLIDIDSLYDFAYDFYKEGGKLLIIDEIHKYTNFEKELKNIYDSLDIKIIFSGSSAINLDNSKADLSRRAVIYDVKGLSFREFLELKYDMKLDSYTLEEIVTNHINIAMELDLKFDIYKDTKEYFEFGYYPFYFENEHSYHIKLNETINTIIEVDIPSVFPIEYTNIINLKKLVKLVCSSKPFSINIKDMLEKLNMKNDYNRLYKYLYYLKKAKVFNILYPKSRGDNIFSKPSKLYLSNTNLHYSYCNNSEVGTIREVFFMSMFDEDRLSIPNKGDFVVDDRYTFEVGGKNKSFKQIKDLPDSFVVSDDIEIGSGNKIPLWLFGFLY